MTVSLVSGAHCINVHLTPEKIHYKRKRNSFSIPL